MDGEFGTLGHESVSRAGDGDETPVKETAENADKLRPMPVELAKDQSVIRYVQGFGHIGAVMPRSRIRYPDN